jgi:prepilin-type processing-associated H-X9-DG protein
MHRGLTLIEVLVVISLIEILAALLWPVFAAARDAAWGISCMSQARQVGMALRMWANDHGGYFPPSARGLMANVEPWWVVSIFPYLQISDPSVFRCPRIARGHWVYSRENPCNHVTTRPFFPHPYYCSLMAFSWGLNYVGLSPIIRRDRECAPDGWPNDTPRPRVWDTVPFPAETILIADAGYVEEDGSHLGYPLIDPPSDRGTNDCIWWWGGWKPEREIGEGGFGRLMPRHNGRVTVIFLDGHARAMRLSQLGTGRQWGLE